MAHAQKKTTTPRRRKATEQAATKSGSVEGRENLNKRRRDKYRENEEYRESVKEDQRSRYRETHGIAPSTLPKSGLKTKGSEREVVATGMDPITTEVYTLREAADAIGKTLLTIRTWLENEILPPLVLEDTSFGYQQFSRGELEVIVRILKDHEREFRYLRTNHTETIERLWAELEAYRAEYV